MTDPEKAAATPKACFKGSCTCGRMTFESNKKPYSAQACHCVTCRKLSGGPYMAFADVESKALTFFDTKEQLRYEGLPKDNFGGLVYKRFSHVGERAYCESCYTPLAMRYKHNPASTSVNLGSIDEDSMTEEVKDAVRIQSHIFTSQKVWWIDLEKDGLPTYARFSGDFEKDIDWEAKQG